MAPVAPAAAVLSRLEAAGERIARARTERLQRRLAQALPNALPADLRVEHTAEGLAISGRRIRQRALTDPRLRTIVPVAREASRG